MLRIASSVHWVRRYLANIQLFLLFCVLHAVEWEWNISWRSVRRDRSTWLRRPNRIDAASDLSINKLLDTTDRCCTMPSQLHAFFRCNGNGKYRLNALGSEVLNVNPFVRPCYSLLSPIPLLERIGLKQCVRKTSPFECCTPNSFYLF